MNCEEMLNTQAEMVLAKDPGIPGEQPRVWVYRNTIKALNWFTSVREKLVRTATRVSRSCLPASSKHHSGVRR